jgi:hypothetical protein
MKTTPMNGDKIPLSSHVSDETIRRNPHLYSVAERMRAGLVPQTPTKRERQAERAIHDAFEQWLSLHRDDLCWNHSRMDRKTSDRVGWPDFTIVSKGSICLIEMKRPGEKPTDAQREVHTWLNATGTPVWLCHSAAGAIETTRRELGIK